LLGSLYELEQHAVHTPQDLDWLALADSCIVQLHWQREPAFISILASNGFQAVTIARHPLAVLLSIWQFAPHEPQTASWLDGEGGNETAILGRSLSSAEFHEYACGPRARALLSVSAQWWETPGVLKTRYEELVDKPEKTLAILCESLGATRIGIQEALEINTLEKLRATSTNHHFWQGKPEAWRTMIPDEIAMDIQRAHREIFERLGYAI
jgi:hypothetical protein